MIQEKDLEKRRQQLEQALAHLQEQLGGKLAKKDRRTGNNLDRDDLAHNFAMRERRFALHDVQSEQMSQIEKALNRITDGTYGVCASCRTPIASGRLDIIPYATLCVRCQQDQDQH